MTDTADPPPGERADWSLPVLLIFRFTFLLVLLFLATTLGYELLWRVPFGESVGTFWFNAVQNYWMPTPRWVARDLLGITPEPFSNEAPAPPVFQLFSVAGVAVLAATGAAVWSAVRPRDREYRRLHAWLRVLLRFSLGILLLSYGVGKLFLAQFRYPPSPEWLMTPVGEMGRFWLLTVFASVPLYQMFAGIAEVTAGALLLIRRTAPLGALLAVFVMIHVVVLNFAFHFTMYVVATSMLFMAIILVLPYLPSLLHVLVGKDRPPAVAHYLLFEGLLARRSTLVISCAFLIAEVGFLVKRDIVRSSETQAAFGPPGLYEVERIVHDGQEPPALAETSLQWLAIAGNSATLGVSGEAARLVLRADTATKILTTGQQDRATDQQQWGYSFPNPSSLALQRQLGGYGTVTVTFRRRELADLPLLRTQPWFR
jgi:uncharacterized membrane protein YphA (DoxX/SURF4 family)